MSFPRTKEQVTQMRAACAVAAKVLYELKALVRPGVTTQDLDEAGRDLIAAAGARSADHGYQIGNRRYPAYTCISVNEEVVHGVPSLRRVIQDGDIVSIDVTVRHQGYVGDNAITIPVGNIRPELQKLIDVTEHSLALGIAQARPGNRIGDISHAVQSYVELHKFSVVRDYVGHGVGELMHEPPEIPNFGKPGRGPVLKPGMTIAIEPMVNLGHYRTKVLSDGWTVVTADGSPSAHFEHTILIGDKGPEILTVPPAAS